MDVVAPAFFNMELDEEIYISNLIDTKFQGKSHMQVNEIFFQVEASTQVLESSTKGVFDAHWMYRAMLIPVFSYDLMNMQQS